MMELLRTIVNITPPFNMIVIVTVVGCSVAVVGIIATEIRKFACHRQTTELKRELVERGLSVDETAEVMHMSSITVIREWNKAKAWLYRELSNN